MNMLNEPVRGICFDKDGTLFDFGATWESWAHASMLRLAQGDVSRATALGQVVGFDFAARVFYSDSIVIAGTPAEVAQMLLPHVPELTHEMLLNILDEEAARAPQVPAVELIPFLKQLRALGLMLGVATNDSEAPARAHLGEAGITDMLDFVAGYDSGFGGKPAAGQLLAFAKAVGLDPSQIVMVGDSTHDLRAGRAAGMRTIGVLTGAAGRDVLAPLADVVLQSIGDIPEWLMEQAEG